MWTSHIVLMQPQLSSYLMEWATAPSQLFCSQGKGWKGPEVLGPCDSPEVTVLWRKPERNCLEVLAPAIWVSSPGTIAKAALALVWATVMI